MQGFTKMITVLVKNKGWVCGPSDYSVRPSPNWTFWTALSLGLGLGGLDLNWGLTISLALALRYSQLNLMYVA